MVSTSNSIFCLVDGNHCCAAIPYLWKPRGVHLFSIPGLSSKVVTFLSLCSYAAKFKKTHIAIKPPWRKAPNGVTLFNQSQRLIWAHPYCGFTGRVSRAELCSGAGWLSWSSCHAWEAAAPAATAAPAVPDAPAATAAGLQGSLSFLGKAVLPGTAFEIITSQ